MSFNPQGRAAAFAALPVLVAACLLPPAAGAHHLMELLHLAPTPLTGLLSGLAHPLIGPDHLLFLLALSLVGLQLRAGRMLALLATGLAGSALGLVLPGLPGTEALLSLTLVLEALVLLLGWDRRLLLPAFALHGYGLSSSVLGWTAAPIATYLLGLMLSQGALLLLALGVLRRGVDGVALPARRTLAAVLLGIGTAWTWSALVG